MVTRPSGIAVPRDWSRGGWLAGRRLSLVAAVAVTVAVSPARQPNAVKALFGVSHPWADIVYPVRLAPPAGSLPGFDGASAGLTGSAGSVSKVIFAGRSVVLVEVDMRKRHALPRWRRNRHLCSHQLSHKVAKQPLRAVFHVAPAAEWQRTGPRNRHGGRAQPRRPRLRGMAERGRRPGQRLIKPGGDDACLVPWRRRGELSPLSQSPWRRTASGSVGDPEAPDRAAR